MSFKVYCGKDEFGRSIESNLPWQMLNRQEKRSIVRKVVKTACGALFLFAGVLWLTWLALHRSS